MGRGKVDRKIVYRVLRKCLQLHRLRCVEWEDDCEWRLENDVEGRCRGLFQALSQNLPGEVEVTQRNTSVSMTDLRTEFWTRDLSKTKPWTAQFTLKKSLRQRDLDWTGQWWAFVVTVMNLWIPKRGISRVSEEKGASQIYKRAHGRMWKEEEGGNK